MNRPAVFAGLTVLTLLAAAVPLTAHHSFAAEYDRNRTITVTGAVTKLEWTNPHDPDEAGEQPGRARHGNAKRQDKHSGEHHQSHALNQSTECAVL